MSFPYDENDRYPPVTEEDMLEIGGMILDHTCRECAFVGDGEELNDLGYCYQHCRMVKPNWGCNEFQFPKGD